MKEIAELQKHIDAYSKTREIYTQYRKPHPKKAVRFYEKHTGEIRSCQATKRYFDSIGMKKLPSIQSLKQKYAALLAKNKKIYPELKQARTKIIELMTAKNNVERILAMSEQDRQRDHQREKGR